MDNPENLWNNCSCMICPLMQGSLIIFAIWSSLRKLNMDKLIHLLDMIILRNSFYHLNLA